MIAAATLTGLVDLERPDVALLTPAAIAHGLARLTRWAGDTELPVSVAQHSVLVMELFIRRHPELRPHAVHALLHDAHEMLIGDVVTPFVRLLDSRLPGTRQHVEAIKLELDRAIRAGLGLSGPSIDVLAAIGAADRLAACVEWESFVPPANGPCPYGAVPRGLPTRLKALAWPDAESAFREALDRELSDRRWLEAA